MTTQKPFSSSLNPFLAALAPVNPFATASDEVPANAPEGSYTYQLVQSGPAVPAEEIEIPVAAIEVLIRWGATVLHVAQLSPVRSFFVGEDNCDFFLPEEKLGTRRLPLVLVEGGAVHLMIPAGATGTVTLPGEKARSVTSDGRITLGTGASAKLEYSGISFEISAENAGKKAGRFSLRGESLPYTGLSLLVHASLLAATALFMPRMAEANEDGIPDQQVYAMQAMMGAEAMREPEKVDEHAPEAQPGAHGDAGQAGPGEMGKAGSTASRDTNKRFSVEGKGGETYLSRTEAIQAAQEFGMIGLLASLGGSVNAPTSPFGRELANGPDAASFKGNMFGETIGDAMGTGGLNLTGIGEGGDGPGTGIGLTHIGTIGHDLTPGNGHSTWIPKGTHTVKSPGITRVGIPTVGGRLPPEIVQRVVRQNFGRFKACYEGGLRGNPNLAGRVAVRFVIGRDGAVSNVGNGGSDLPDAGVVSCVTRAFYGLSFPQPENGIVTVTYPIVFTPAN